MGHKSRLRRPTWLDVPGFCSSCSDDPADHAVFERFLRREEHVVVALDDFCQAGTVDGRVAGQQVDCPHRVGVLELGFVSGTQMLRISDLTVVGDALAGVDPETAVPGGPALLDGYRHDERHARRLTRPDYQDADVRARLRCQQPELLVHLQSPRDLSAKRADLHENALLVVLDRVNASGDEHIGPVIADISVETDDLAALVEIVERELGRRRQHCIGGLHERRRWLGGAHTQHGTRNETALPAGFALGQEVAQLIG